MKRVRSTYVVYGILFAVGLALRVQSIFYMGVYDMNSYQEWGANANQVGLPETFKGIHYPAQYQVFQVCAAVTARTGWPPHVALKATNLLFDIALFALLIVIMRRRAIKPAYAFMYWLHPWFIAVSWQGYCDAQYAFLAVLTAFLADDAKTLKSFFLAGIPLGIAFLMKPQAEVLFLAVAGYAAVLGFRERGTPLGRWQAMALLVPACILYAGYSLYFWYNGVPLMKITDAYTNTASDMPCITALMLNIWYPIASFLAPGSMLHSFTDAHIIFGPITIRRVAIALTLGYLWALAVVIARRKQQGREPHDWTLLFAGASLILPLLMTSAHENHLFLASVFFILIMHAMAWKTFLWVNVALAIQFVHIFGLYGLGDNVVLVAMTSRVRGAYANALEVSFVLSILDSLCLIAVLNAMFALRLPEKSRCERLIPGALLVGLVLLAYDSIFMSLRHIRW